MRCFSLDIKNSKDAILLDLFLYALKFAKGHQWTPEKTSTFFSILKLTHQNAMGKKYGVFLF